MRSVVWVALLLGGCASGELQRPRPVDAASLEAYRKAFVTVRAKPTLDRTFAPDLPTYVQPDQKLVAVKIAVCTDIAGKFTNSEVKTGSGDMRFDRAVQAWLAKASYTPALNMNREPIATCETMLDLIWQRDIDDGVVDETVAKPVNPLLLPEYPAGALRSRQVGQSDATICLDEEGRVTEIQKSASPSPSISYAFEAWLRATPFEPVSRDGGPAATCGLAFGMYWHLP
jgi:hypothetical protein